MDIEGTIMGGKMWACPFFLLVGLAPGCRKDAPIDAEAPGTPVGIALEVVHEVDGAALHFDTVAYQNEHGDAYEVTRLQYFLSDLWLAGAQGTPDVYLPGPWYVDAREHMGLLPGTVPPGHYAGGGIHLGLPPDLNVTNALPNTLEHVNMAWPGPMGGGYHFLKFEGHFMQAGSPTGFAIHLGKDEHLVHVHFSGPVEVGEADAALQLRFNLNEVFRGPHTYALAEGNYSMGSDALMALLHENCSTAFTLVPRP